MKKGYIFCFIFISALWLSCKKDKHSETSPDGSLHTVSFNIINFTQENTAVNQDNKVKLNAAVSLPSSNIIKLVYKLYTTDGTLLKTLVINKGDPTFTAFSDNLIAGNYVAVFVGIVNSKFFSNYQNEKLIYYSDEEFSEYFDETFYKKVSFSVGTTDQQVGVDLQRLNSGLQIVINSALPASVTKFRIDISSIGNADSYWDDKPAAIAFGIRGSGDFSYYKSVTVPANKIGSTNFTVGPFNDIMTLDLTSNITITAYTNAYDGNTGSYAIYSTRQIQGIKFQRNTLTTLTGNPFTNPATAGSSVVITYQPYNQTGLTQGF